MEILADHERVLLRSQSGPRVWPHSERFTSCAICFFDDAVAVCILLLASADVVVQTTRWAVVGQLARGRECSADGFAVESVARMCSEAGGRVSATVMDHDFDLAAFAPLGEKAAGCGPLWSVLHQGCTPHRRDYVGLCTSPGR